MTESSGHHVSRRKKEPSSKPSVLVFIARFILGALFGVLITIGTSTRAPLISAHQEPILCVIAAVVFGVFAAILGDKFFNAVFRPQRWR